MLVLVMLFILVFFTLMLFAFSMLLNVAVIRVLIGEIDAVNESTYFIEATLDLPNIRFRFSKDTLVFPVFFVAMFVVETRGRSLEEVQRLFGEGPAVTKVEEPDQAGEDTAPTAVTATGTMNEARPLLAA